MTEAYKRRRARRHQLQAVVREALLGTTLAKGVPGRVAGARPAQLSAAAKQIVQRWRG